MNTKNNNLFGSAFNQAQTIRGCILLTMAFISFLPANADNTAKTKLHVSGRVVSPLQLTSPVPPETSNISILTNTPLTTESDQIECPDEYLCSRLLLTGKSDYHFSFLIENQSLTCQSTLNRSSTHGILNTHGNDVISCQKTSEATQANENATMLFD